MTETYHQLVSEIARLFKKATRFSSSGLKKAARKKSSSDSPYILIFSPHPDDECIVGGLALRLLREAKWNVVNVAVTLGSKPERKAARLRELKNACDYLGFGLVVPGLENINLETRKKNPVHWRSAIGSIAGILAQQRPRMIFLPHEKDGHPTHIGTHFLVLDALKTLPREFECFVVETEFWGQMTNPNLVVESGVEDVAGLVAALACHTGEVRRNPYHARLPAWMLDNVRRGAEIVGGHGGAAPNLTFGTIYRFGKWRGGRRQKVFKHRKILSAAKSLAGLFDGI